MARDKPYQLTESIFGLIKTTKVVGLTRKKEWHAVFVNGPYKGMKASHSCGANGAIKELIAAAYWDEVHNSDCKGKGG